MDKFTEEAKKKMSEAKKKLWRDPEFLNAYEEKIGNKISNKMKSVCSDPTYRQQMSSRGKQNWTKPDYVKKHKQATERRKSEHYQKLIAYINALREDVSFAHTVYLATVKTKKIRKALKNVDLLDQKAVAAAIEASPALSKKAAKIKQVLEIRKLHMADCRITDIADYFHMNASNVGAIITGKTWKELNEVFNDQKTEKSTL